MTRTLISLTAVCLITLTAGGADLTTSRSLAWVNRYSGPSAPVNAIGEATKTVVDAHGDVIVTGIFRNVEGNNDLYTAKYAATTGALLWEQLYNGPGHGADAVGALALDASGNVIVAGSSSSLPEGSGDYALYTAKYSAADGTLLWEKRATNKCVATAVAVDGDGNVIVTGKVDTSHWASNSSSPGEGVTGIVIITRPNEYYVYDYATYTAKYSGADGALLWEKVANSSYPRSLALDSLGNAIVVGIANDDFYTAKYAATDGSLIWRKTLDGKTHRGDEAVAVAVDSSDNVIVTGKTNGVASNLQPVVTFKGSNGDIDICTVKYSALDGALLWERRYEGPANCEDQPVAVSVDAAGNVFVIGTSYNLVSQVIIIGSGPANLPNYSDVYIAKYAASDGAVLWEKRFDASTSGYDYATDLHVDWRGNVVVSGFSQDGSLKNSAFTLAYAGADGSQLWEHRYNGTGTESAYFAALALDPWGDVVMAGSVSSNFFALRLATPAEIAVSRSTGSLLSDGGSTVDFGFANGFTAGPKVITIRNTGGSDLILDPIIKDGATAEDFTVSAPGLLTLPPGASTAFTVAFASAVPESRVSALHIPSNDTAQSPFDIALAGTGSLISSPAPANDATPSSLLPTLSWSGPAGSTYQVFLGTVSGSLSPIANTGNTSSTVLDTALTPGTRYFWRVDATLNGSTTTGPEFTFTAPLRRLATDLASNVLSGWAMLNGSVNPIGLPTTAYFQYGTTTEYGSSTLTNDLGNGTSIVTVNYNLNGLTPGATYHYRMVTTMGGNTYYGADQTFTTPVSSPPDWHYVRLSSNSNAALGGKHTAQPSTAYTYFHYYKGTDSKIWALWYGGGGWNQAPLTATANVDDWFTENTTYNQLYYKGTDNHIYALWYGAGKWNQLALTTNPNVLGELQTDSGTNFTYYRGSDNNLWVLWYGAGKWNQAPLTSSAKVAGDVVVDSKYHFAYYRGTDSQMWVVWFGAGKWNEAKLSTTANVAGDLLVDPGWGTYYKDGRNTTWAVWFTGVQWAQTNLGVSTGATSGPSSLYGHLGVIYTGTEGAAHYLGNNGVAWSISPIGPNGLNLSDTLNYKASEGFIYGRTADGNLGVFYYQ